MSPAQPGKPRVAIADIEVRYAETDQMGVVHHSVYLVWFELARTRLCESSGWHYADIERLGYLLMVTAAHLDYRRPARYGDTVHVACHVERLGSRGITFAYEVRASEGPLARGTTRHVWVHRDNGRPCRMPRELKRPFEELAGRA